MKKLSLIIAIGIISALCYSNKTAAQEKPFVLFEYMHVKPDNRGAYLQVENFWKHIHLAQQKNGNILTWSVWEVVAPYGMNAKYQYVVVTAYKHFSDYLDPYKGIELHSVFPNASQDSLKKMFSKTADARDLIKSDIFRVQDNISNNKDTRYVLAWYVKVPWEKDSGFLSFMKNHRKPLASDVIAKGFADQWWYGELMFPAGSDAAYNHIICVQWDRDDMFDKEPPFNQYKKKDPIAFEGHKWMAGDHGELLHRVVSLTSDGK